MKTELQAVLTFALQRGDTSVIPAQLQSCRSISTNWAMCSKHSGHDVANKNLL